MWKRIVDEMPPVGAPVLLCAKPSDGRWRFMAVPEWSEQDSRLRAGKKKEKTVIFWQLIQKPDDDEEPTRAKETTP